MTQAFYTSIGGINAAQSQINLIANNVANINTVGFKESNMTFADVYYNTLSSGSAPTSSNGGKNPAQIGLGVQVSAINTKFTNGTVSTTGNNTDMNIQGNGFFCVQNSSGSIMYTRAGNFSVDANGNLVNPNGYKVMGTNNIFGTQGSDIPVKIPTLIKTETIANTENLDTKNIEDLNGASIIKGTFSIIADMSPSGGASEARIDVDISNCKDLKAVAQAVNDAIAAAGIDPASISAKCDNSTGGKFEISTDTSSCSGLKFESGTSNFISVTDLGGSLPDATGKYSSAVLDYKQVVSQPSVAAEAQGYEDFTVYENGNLEVTYANGDKLSVTFDENTNKNIFKYTTASGIIILGNDVKMDSDVCKVENLQIELAKFVNPDGLINVGSNLYQQSANSGIPYYGFADTSGIGQIKTGGLEASNVDLSKQFSDMIQAQRAIEANSRVFSTSSEVLKTLVYMGQ